MEGYHVDATELPVININKSTGWNIAPEGFVTHDSSLVQNNVLLQLPPFDRQNKQQYFIDIFLTDQKEIDWTATSSASWIKLSTTKGTLSNIVGKKEIRVHVVVDWNKVPTTETFNGQIKVKADGKQIAVAVNAVNRIVNDFKGFVENNGYISITPTHYSRLKKQGHTDWKLLPGLGYAGEVLLSQAVTQQHIEHLNDSGWITKNSSYVEYDFYTFSSTNAELTMFTVPTHPLNNLCSMRYAVSIDEGPLQVADFRTFGRSEEWKQYVLKNRAEKKLSLSYLTKGKHRLRIYSVDPGVMLDALLIDLGGLKQAYSLIPETKPNAATTKPVK
jgi:Gylcosyl hydrolase family 115 C-terminal domain